MKTLYAFDFDGTITDRDTLIGFIASVFGTTRMLLGFAANLPWLLLMRLGLYDNGKTKQRVFSHFFSGMDLVTFNRHCKAYAEQNRHIIRPEMLRLLQTLDKEKTDMVVVSASITNWVAPFFHGLNIKVIGTEAETAAGSLTGRFATPNCYGSEKVTRLSAFFPERDTYNLVAYGDSRGDRELLEYADVSYFKGQPFAKNPHL